MAEAASCTYTTKGWSDHIPSWFDQDLAFFPDLFPAVIIGFARDIGICLCNRFPNNFEEAGDCSLIISASSPGTSYLSCHQAVVQLITQLGPVTPFFLPRFLLQDALLISLRMDALSPIRSPGLSVGSASAGRRLVWLFPAAPGAQGMYLSPSAPSLRFYPISAPGHHSKMQRNQM